MTWKHAHMLAHIDFLEGQIEYIDGRVTEYKSTLERVQTIPGIGRKIAISLIAEIGVDMSLFPSAMHLAS